MPGLYKNLSAKQRVEARQREYRAVHSKQRKLGWKLHSGQCHDCGAKEGDLHSRGCDMERCPFCGGQLISCDCVYKHFYKDTFKPQVWDRQKMCFTGHPTSGLPKDVYEKGVPDDISDKWEEMLEKKGRVPYIVYPNLCRMCGEVWPDFFTVPDEEWAKYIMPCERSEMICRICYDRIKRLIDRGES